MSIPFMSDVSLKSINGNTFFVRTQADFDRVMTAMKSTSTSSPYNHIVIYPNIAGGAYTAVSTGSTSITFAPTTHCLIEGIGQPAIANFNSMSVDTSNGTVSLKGLKATLPLGSADAYFEGFEKIEDCHLTFLEDTPGPDPIFFKNCKNINNVKIVTDVDMTHLDATMFDSCKGVSSITEEYSGSGGPPRSYKRYINCSRIASSCPGAVVYGRGRTTVTGISESGPSPIDHTYCVDYTTHRVTFDSIQYRSSDDVGKVVATIAALKNLVHIPSTAFQLSNGEIVGYTMRVNGTEGVGTVQDIYYNSTLSCLYVQYNMQESTNNIFKFSTTFI